ncbi:MAG TPA: choice-of-anchor D domain-containing protein, partial [Pyrinomonadaceae bacterium]|nr:choice-of-anchor D domain-containing protein [Pyrinomonadaceae bacterium]
LNGDDFANAVAIQPDGKIVAAGTAINSAGNNDFAVVRYNTNGSLDTRFDTDGKATFPVLADSDIASGLAIQPDGKIVVAGTSFNGSQNVFSAIRLNPNGSLDTTFNLVGVTVFPILGSDDVANAVALQTDGKIVMAGYTDNGHDKDFAVVRLNTNGSLDTSFDLDGRVSTGIQVGDDIATSVAIQGDGKIVAAGYSRDVGPDSDFAAVRYNTNGSLDTTFDADGRVTATIRSPDNFARSLAIQPDGKIILAGESDDGTRFDFAVVRLNTDGSLDPSFDTDGKQTIDFQNSSDQGYGVAIQRDGRIVVAGDTDIGTVHNIGIARLGGPCVPEMDVTGNGFTIVDGDTSPSLADQTDFGSTALTGGTVVRTFTIENAGSAGLIILNPTISGTNAADFTVTANPISLVLPGASTTFQVTFDPSVTGLRTATVNIANNDPDENPYNFAIQGTGVAPFSGTVSVGTGQTYTNLTNSDGIFNALNAGGLSGDLTINVTSDLTAETGAVALHQLAETGAGAGTYRVLLKPSAAARTISGSINGSLIRLDGADRVTIDGWSLAVQGGPAGGAAVRDLTITNIAPVSTSVVSIINSSANPSQNNTIQDTIVTGSIVEVPGTITGTQSGIVIGGVSPGPNNNNNHILSCLIKDAKYGIDTSGQSVAIPNTGTRIEQNVLNTTGTDRIRFVGITSQNESGVQIVGNKIGNITSNGAPGTVSGIAVGISDLGSHDANTTAGNSVTGAFISANQINGVVSSSSYTAAGIAVAGASGAPNTIVNNMITGVSSNATSPDIVAGIYVKAAAGSSARLYYNSVAMTGDRGVSSSTPSFGLAIAGVDPTVELKNNIFFTTQTAVAGGPGALSFAIGLSSSAYTNLDSNFNVFYSAGAQDGGFRTRGLLTGFTDLANLAAWRTEVSDDANSLEVDPLFVAPPSDLHLQLVSPVVNVGTPIPSVTVDFDGETRSATTPDIGADEIAGAPEISVEDFSSTVLVDGVSTVNFGSELIGLPGIAKTFTVRNLGTDPLTLNTTISVTGTNSTEFTVNNAGMSPTVAPGGNTTFTITFAPLGSGTRT